MSLNPRFQIVRKSMIISFISELEDIGVIHEDIITSPTTLKLPTSSRLRWTSRWIKSYAGHTSHLETKAFVLMKSGLPREARYSLVPGEVWTLTKIVGITVPQESIMSLRLKDYPY